MEWWRKTFSRAEVSWSWFAVMMTDGPPCYLGHFLTSIGYLPSVWDLAGKCHHNSSLEAALSSSSPSSLKRSLSSLSSNVQNELEAKIFLKCL